MGGIYLLIDEFTRYGTAAEYGALVALPLHYDSSASQQECDDNNGSAESLQVERLVEDERERKK